METAHSSPAAAVIRKLGGIDATARIVGRHRSVVNRWLLPPESGGTNGEIPPKHWPVLIDAGVTLDELRPPATPNQAAE